MVWIIFIGFCRVIRLSLVKVNRPCCWPVRPIALRSCGGALVRSAWPSAMSWVMAGRYVFGSR